MKFLGCHPCMLVRQQHVAVELLLAKDSKSDSNWFFANHMYNYVYLSFFIYIFFLGTMDPLCGTPCGSAAAQPHVEVTEIKSNSQFPKPWITVNPSVPILSQNANILAQYEQSAEARNGRCYYVPRPFFWSDAGTFGPCNDDVGSSILHDFAALIDPSCHSFFITCVPR